MAPPEPVICRREGVLGRITLNRPAKLNALDLGMIRAMRAALLSWRHDRSVSAVVLDGAGERSFCAGGDIAVVHHSAVTDPRIAQELWREEYRLDAQIARFSKPVVALMEGITMGGGMGIGCHAAVRIVTERTELAMPEVGIGLAPDVGGALLLSRAPGEIGTHLALTGDRVRAADALYCGIADHLVESSRLPDLVADLAAGHAIDQVVRTYARPPQAAALQVDRRWIDASYAEPTVEDILRRLRARPEAAAGDAAGKIVAGSPTAAKVTLRALRTARSMSTIEECLRQDYRLSVRFLAQPDLVEGIRAAVLDKDRRPRWRPARLVDVTGETVEHFFRPLDDDLVLPGLGEHTGEILADGRVGVNADEDRGQS